MAAPSPCAIGEGFPQGKVSRLIGRASTYAKLCAWEAGDEGGGGDYGWQDSDLLARLDEVLLPGTHRQKERVSCATAWAREPSLEGGFAEEALLVRFALIRQASG